jgi:hypothetical protein
MPDGDSTNDSVAASIPFFSEGFRISGIEVGLTEGGQVWCQGQHLGRVAREQRFDQWFWRAYDLDPTVEIKRFFTSRPEAIQLLLLRADLIEGIGF